MLTGPTLRRRPANMDEIGERNWTEKKAIQIRVDVTPPPSLKLELDYETQFGKEAFDCSKDFSPYLESVWS